MSNSKPAISSLQLLILKSPGQGPQTAKNFALGAALQVSQNFPFALL
jgi:hypothetical protein